MDEVETKSSVDQFIDRLSIVSEGHKLPDGRLNPLLEDQQIKNKLVAIVLNHTLQRSGRTVEALRRLLELHPTQADLLREEVQKLSALRGYEKDLFEERNSL